MGYFVVECTGGSRGIDETFYIEANTRTEAEDFAYTLYLERLDATALVSEEFTEEELKSEDSEYSVGDFVD